MTNKQNVWIRKKLTELIDIYGGKCMVCGSEENLEFAHVKPTELSGRGRGRKERYYDVKYNPDCYCLMCEDCHKYYDSVLRDEEAL